MVASFEWDEKKNIENQAKHHISFEKAQRAFTDPERLIYKDKDHSTATEVRYFCLGQIDKQVCTVRFMYRNNRVRIFGAGYWRKEQKIYEQKNKKTYHY